MQPIPSDQQAEFEITVTDEMTVQFEELGAIHPVYATYWMTKHMELVGRKLLLPFLERDEEAIGHEVSVRHIASALPGMRVRLIADQPRVEKNRVYIHCQVYNELSDLIGEGQTTQVVLPRHRLDDNFQQMQARWQQFQRSNMSHSDNLKRVK
ncbi:thioesterase family protein [Dictyobacter aurantiacus]|uniref:Thioesterase n=1 Tax=Dictyobacter aurantiacus TaxID=1936993 RepID=A0A401ZI28_9CHLR|nr:thioesterase family protein [Dictyobacter aurantiacus]GCE06494.1 thioesterase [Dictyobacter aurantiacus]